MEAIPFSIEKYNDLVVRKETHIVKTIAETPVRILCDDRLGCDYPIVGLILYKHEQEVDSWTIDGKCRMGSGKDLYISPKPPVSLGWAAVYQQNSISYFTRLCETRQEVLRRYEGAQFLSEPIEIFAKP